MEEIYNRATISLAYKLVSHFSKKTSSEVSLFGGIVRDAIVPALSKGENPFSPNFRVPFKLGDIDVVVKCTRNTRNFTLMKWVRKFLIPKLLEWDWTVLEMSRDDEEKNAGYVQSMQLVRMTLRHSFVDIDVGLDLVDSAGTERLDFDVNSFSFSRANGLELRTNLYPNADDSVMNIIHLNSMRVKLFNQIRDRQCQMLLSSDSVENIPAAFDRFAKMVKKGWTILNLGENVEIVSGGECQICAEHTDLPCIHLTCSRCVMCLDCTKNVLSMPRVFDDDDDDSNLWNLKCPTCRKIVSLVIKNDYAED